MKLSGFMQDRQLEFFVNDRGVEESRIVEPVLQEKIKFHPISKKLLEEFKSIKINEEDNYEEVTYKLIDILTDVDKDISFEDFQEILAYPPNDQFITFVDEINKSFINLVKRFNKFKENIDNTNKELTESISKLPEELKEKIEEGKLSNEERLTKLEEQYIAEENGDKKRDLLKQMAKLQLLIENKNNN
ncbi:hypothetical protein [Clostridium kluyveri]|uniref:Uncharacterized protein n=1 Tax=Clostridium kluyveri TaxID=1534 RepID=A0A1L5F4D4_CLOKL|nr:hypothetical protein [Clostridium kluyveri]APM37802.1 hypothetical protein BS101_03105 [Clostridium kluyveri]